MALRVVAARVRNADGRPPAADDAEGNTCLGQEDLVHLPRQLPLATDVALRNKFDPSP